MGVSRSDQNIQVKDGKAYSMSGSSMFTYSRVQQPRYWKEEGFEYLDHTLLMCEIKDPSTSKPVRLACSGALNDIQ